MKPNPARIVPRVAKAAVVVVMAADATVETAVEIAKVAILSVARTATVPVVD
jgi:hypothetical protein